MELNNQGYKIICDFEGLRLKPYLCSAGVPTIGYGNTFYPSGAKVTMRDKLITKEYAFEIFKTVANMFAKNVNSLITSKVNQNQFNSLVSFAYNVGTDIDQDNIPEGLGDSTLLKKINLNPNNITISNEFAKWNKSLGKVNKGLVTRRKKESDIYFSKIV